MGVKVYRITERLFIEMLIQRGIDVPGDLQLIGVESGPNFIRAFDVAFHTKSERELIQGERPKVYLLTSADGKTLEGGEKQ